MTGDEHPYPDRPYSDRPAARPSDPTAPDEVSVSPAEAKSGGGCAFVFWLLAGGAFVLFLIGQLLELIFG
ncbi:MAG: hypothetical protein WBL06_12205 [Pseudolysinimonas sp.]|uniref:hypothetical protein n=1 Tax=Pseudolysinimonas sp. TaxID=2680009 RepID=UPI003C75818C